MGGPAVRRRWLRAVRELQVVLEPEQSEGEGLVELHLGGVQVALAVGAGWRLLGDEGMGLRAQDREARIDQFGEDVPLAALVGRMRDFASFQRPLQRALEGLLQVGPGLVAGPLGEVDEAVAHERIAEVGRAVVEIPVGLDQSAESEQQAWAAEAGGEGGCEHGQLPFSGAGTTAAVVVSQPVRTIQTSSQDISDPSLSKV